MDRRGAKGNPLRDRGGDEGFQKCRQAQLGRHFPFRYKDPQNKLFYLGPGEGADVRLEAVKLLDPENDEVTIFFDRASKLPAKIEYRSITSGALVLREVEEYSQWLVTQGVNGPLRIERYQNGFKSSLQYVVKISYNNNLPDSFFGKPETQK